MLYLEIPLSDFSFTIDNSKKEYEAKVAVLVTLRNAAGRMIEKFSQEFPLRGPKDKAAETRQRNLVFYRKAELAGCSKALLSQRTPKDCPAFRESAGLAHSDFADHWIRVVETKHRKSRDP